MFDVKKTKKLNQRLECEFGLCLTQPYKTSLYDEDAEVLLILYKPYLYSQGNGLNPPIYTKHNNGIRGNNEDNPNTTIRRPEINHNEGEFSTVIFSKNSFSWRFVLILTPSFWRRNFQSIVKNFFI